MPTPNTHAPALLPAHLHTSLLHQVIILIIQEEVAAALAALLLAATSLIPLAAATTLLVLHLVHHKVVLLILVWGLLVLLVCRTKVNQEEDKAAGHKQSALHTGMCSRWRALQMAVLSARQVSMP
jgi:hypothetical protein